MGITLNRGIGQIPLIGDFNGFRKSLYEREDFHLAAATPSQVGAWFLHKPVAIVSIPINIAAASAAAGLFVLSACTLGLCKVAVFAVTLGNYTLPISTGCEYFGLWALTHTWESLCSIYEPTVDILCDPIREGYTGIRWIGRQLHLDGFFAAIFRKMREAVDFCIERIGVGVLSAVKYEPACVWDWTTFPGLNDVNSWVKSRRIRMRDEFDSRPMENILFHTAASFATVPVNLIVGIVSTISSVAMSALWLVKVLFTAVTTVDVPVPTFTANLMHCGLTMVGTAVADTAHVVGDCLVVLPYKAAKITRIWDALAALGDVFLYIPRAIFTNQ